LDIHTKMKRVLRAIDAIPLHLSLDIVRFDDALGESWALPFQACKHWAVSYVLSECQSTMIASHIGKVIHCGH
jgi:hypothetical protein